MIAASVAGGAFGLGMIFGLLALTILAKTAKAVVLYMPYALGAVISAMAYFALPGVQNLIPGHPWMCFITVLAITEILLIVMLRTATLAKPAITFCCAVFLVFAGAIAFDRMPADSIGYCVFVTLIFWVLSFAIVAINLRDTHRHTIRRNLPLSIIAGTLYGLSIMILVNSPADILWKHYLVRTGINEARYELGLTIACIILGLLVMVWTLLVDWSYRDREMA